MRASGGLFRAVSALIALGATLAAGASCAAWTTQCVAATESCSGNASRVIFPGDADTTPENDDVIRLCPEGYACKNAKCVDTTAEDRNRISAAVAILRANYSSPCAGTDAPCCAVADTCPLACRNVTSAGFRCTLSAGKQVIGDICAYDDECASGKCGRLGRCVAPFIVAAHAPCTPGASVCEDGFFCSASQQACTARIRPLDVCDDQEQGAQCAGDAVCTTVFEGDASNHTCRDVLSLPANTVFSVVTGAEGWMCRDGYVAGVAESRFKCLSKASLDASDTLPCNVTDAATVPPGFKCGCLPAGSSVAVPAAVNPFFPGDPSAAAAAAATLLRAISKCQRSTTTSAFSAFDCRIRSMGRRDYCALYPYSGAGDSILSLTPKDVRAIHVPPCAVNPLASAIGLGGTVKALQEVCEGHLATLCDYVGPGIRGRMPLSVCDAHPTPGPSPDGNPGERWLHTPWHVVLVVAIAVVATAAAVAVFRALGSGHSDRATWTDEEEHVPRTTGQYVRM